MNSIDTTIIVATGNSGKMDEIREILHDLPCQLVSMREYWKAIVEIDENGKTFMENAHIKAAWVHKHSFKWALADDSGLVVDALDGAPGIYSARFAGAHGDTAANNHKLLGLLAGVPAEKRTARFVCAVTLYLGNSVVLEAEGVCNGRIIESLQGSGGFGYDPLFIPDGYDTTFAELDSEEKHRISHRGKALRELRRLMHEHIPL